MTLAKWETFVTRMIKECDEKEPDQGRRFTPEIAVADVPPCQRFEKISPPSPPSLLFAGRGHTGEKSRASGTLKAKRHTSQNPLTGPSKQRKRLAR